MAFYKNCNIELLKRSQEEYKIQMTKCFTIEELLYNAPALNKLIQLFPACRYPIEIAFEKRSALQPSILSEYAAFSALGQRLGCINVNFLFSDDNCRCEYLHPLYPIVIKQYGGCQYLDGEIWYNDRLIRRFEVKQNLARSTDNDLTLDKEGNLLIPDNLKNIWTDYEPFINSINVWDWVNQGNIKLDDADLMKKITYSYLNRFPNTDILIWGEYGLYLLNAESYFKYSNNQGSEIRPFGKNNRKAYSLNKLNFYIKQLGGIIQNNEVILPKDKIVFRKGRGMEKITRCIINSAFYVKIEDICEEKNTVRFLYNKVREKRPNISIHVRFEEK